MGKLNSFSINLDNPAGVYYAGTMIQGHVTVELKESMKMRGIRLNIEGKAKVHWVERHQNSARAGNSARSNRAGNSDIEHFYGDEKYFDQDILLHGIWPSQGSNTLELSQGRHTFPFQLQLPPGLPSSFEGEHGHVRYVVSCKIDKPWKFDHKTKRPFTIISILDLNSQSSYSQRLQSTNEKTLCCLCCKSGPITATFNLDRQGYVPGEAIKLNAEISNGSNRNMDKSYVDLKMTISYKATRRPKTKTVTKKIALVSRPSIPAHSEDVWSGEELVIPPLPPSYLVGCGIIDIKYFVQLNVDPSGPALDLEIPFEIVIGTIPLMAVVQQFPPLPPVGFTPNAPWPSAPPAIMPNLPPPSYNECITGKVDIRDDDDGHTYGELDFAPAYTYYNWGHTPGALPAAEPEN